MSANLVGRIGTAGLLLGLASCAAPVPTDVEHGKATPPERDPRALDATASRAPAGLAPRTAQDDSALTPAILLPAVPSDDGVVASAGAFAIRKAHVFDRLLDSDPKRARELVDVLVLDALVAQEAARHGITVDRAKVEKLADEQQRQLSDQVQKDFAGSVSFAQYLERQFAMTQAEYRHWLVLNLARKLYREYVARYTALLSERVQVRYLVASDKSVVVEAKQRAEAGADFASLCTRWSEDALRQDGGLLPPFARGFQHPVAKAAFELEPGQVSSPLAIERDGATKWYLVYCMKRLPAREATFAAARAELDAAIEAQPMSKFEFDAFYLQLRAAAEKLPSASKGR